MKVIFYHSHLSSQAVVSVSFLVYDKHAKLSITIFKGKPCDKKPHCWSNLLKMLHAVCAWTSACAYLLIV